MRRRYRRFLRLNLSRESAVSLLAVLLLLSSLLSFLSFYFQLTEVNLFQEYLNSLFGHGVILLPFLLGVSGLLLLRATPLPFLRLNHLLGLILFTISFLGLSHLFIAEAEGQEQAALGQGGGYLGYFLASFLRRTFSGVGAFFILLSLLAVAWVVAFNQPWEKVLVWPFLWLTRARQLFGTLSHRPALISEREGEEKKAVSQQLPLPAAVGEGEAAEKEVALEVLPPPTEPVGPEGERGVREKEKKESRGERARPVLPLAEEVWEYPPLSLLLDTLGAEADRGDIARNASLIEKTLESFGVRAKVVEINKGPAVTQYALESAQGTKIVHIKSLQNDLALALASPTGSVRIEAPIPGKSLIGIEVPNFSPATVTLKSVLASAPMKNLKSKLAVALGHDVAGQAVAADLAKMPHVLVAGATGSGKSTMMHAFLASFLFRASPAELRFLLVDTKRVEFTEYNGLPHLLTPVINDPEKVLASLKWTINEMDRRYRLFQSAKVRDLPAYNELSGFQALPYIVIMVDELADMMALAPVEVEKAICRLAQLSRATGIHLILSTQRPDVHVITGLIKANIPCRIAFNTVSQIDSRVIIDQAGAEKLLGRGDMLYVPPEASKPRRLQGVYVSPLELKKLLEFLKQHSVAPDYHEEITVAAAVKRSEGGEPEDELFAEAVRTVCQYDRASASLLQRRLKVGYARAARLLDELEARGIVGGADGAKPRDVLIHDPEAVLGEAKPPPL